MLGVTFEDKPVKEKKEKKSKDKKKKDKKEKKAKKEKKEKHKEKDVKKGDQDSGSESGSGSPSSGSEDEGKKEAAPQREEWMTKPMESMFLAGKREEAGAKAEAEKAEEERQKKEQEPVIGLRVMKPGDPTAGKGAAAATAPPKRAPVVGDGGLSWRLKALQRSKEQAKEAGLNLQDVVAERWGSLGELSNTLASGTAANTRAHIHQARDRVRAVGGKVTPYGGGEAQKGEGQEGEEDMGEEKRGERGRREEGRGDRPPQPRSSYIAEMKEKRPQMKAPSMNESLSWRKRGREDTEEAGRSNRGEPREREGRDRGEREQGRERGREWEGERGGEGRRWGRDSGGGSSRGPRMSAQQAEALKDVAGEYNTFKDDGSFMERVAKASGSARQERQGDEMAEAEVGAGSDDRERDEPPAGNRGGPAGPSRPHGDDEGVRGGSREGSELPPSTAAPTGAAAGGNKSAAEMLRARLKGLPTPAPAPAAPRPSVAPTAGADRGSRGGRGIEREEEGEEGSSKRSKKETVVLPLVDAQGKAVRGAFGREANTSVAASLPPGQRPPKRTQQYEAGQKARYYADDDKVDLETLVKRAKYGDDMDADLDRTVTNNIMRKQGLKKNELNVEDEYDHDAGVEMYEHKQRKGTTEQAAARERTRQITQLQKSTKLEEQCQFCKSNTRRPAHLIVSAAPSCYLMLPPRGWLDPGHCCIVPNDHIASIRMVDDSVWEEIKNFMKCLIRMFEAQGKHCIFYETAMQLKSLKRHAVLECVPVGQREMDKAPGYFKKGMLEAESEWSTHHAKAVIETSAKKGLHASIPPNFPYVYVQFSYGSGYVHVIDDESQFDTQFARQVLVGLLRLPPEEMHRRHKMESASTQQQWVREFVSMWSPFDWTLQL